MSAPFVTIVAVLCVCMGYAAGRVHQWRRSGWDREQAYRDGYDEATRSTLSMAARIATPAAPAPDPAPAPALAPVAAEPMPAPAPPPVAPAFPAPVGPRIETVADVPFFEPVAHEAGAVPEVPVPRLGRRGRHYVPDELVQAATYRLPADRVARAKVRDAIPPPSTDGDNPVPKPRSADPQ